MATKPNDDPVSFSPKSVIELSKAKTLPQVTVEVEPVKADKSARKVTEPAPNGNVPKKPQPKAVPIIDLNTTKKSRVFSDPDDSNNNDFLPKTYKYTSVEPSMSTSSFDFCPTIHSKVKINDLNREPPAHKTNAKETQNSKKKKKDGKKGDKKFLNLMVEEKTDSKTSHDKSSSTPKVSSSQKSSTKSKRKHTNDSKKR